ncbi:MAG: flagellar basal-body rod protein FlgG [Oleispira antarctica]|jgi:flagellar basal-body rod protein FlgG|uniref:Flagellar basal-body rod protein FlgG n=1 Tax=Oleispira antarctica RB-8 TaxID=698738 RepID=R4YL84_OLEAN|nr:flagellar basal-body rod protein FlgG [Oleispira antarctica]MBQ0794207.1 flagellar basal-body rod protein FlgG [Oleispira antarctica]CCK75372.1 Flagellar basal-body rod protein [Oleispira antarctica RB-8]|tara:strand:- start:919 stop:1704 length:786 start_codon:yes stop_codon:yes gene_type:complete
MHPALWVSKSGLQAQDLALTTVSNNLANVSTTGFKKDRPVFEDLLYQIKRQPGANSSADTRLPSGLQVGTGVRTAGTQKVFTTGSLQLTDQPLDMAVNGRGFFQIQMPDGTLSYTRDGTFHINAEGTIVNVNGYALEPQIDIPELTNQLTISSDGIVQAKLFGDPTPQELGQIDLVDFINPAGLQSTGGNLYKETAASGAPNVGIAANDGFGAIEQGALENSNVEVVEELVKMITVQRAYEMNSKVVSAADQMLQFLTQNT